MPRAARRRRSRPPSSPPEERDLVKRLAEFPAVVAEATERRGPHAIPNYAIRVADDFHRFYHEHKVLGSDAQAFRLGLDHRDEGRDRPLARPDRGRGARPDVAALRPGQRFDSCSTHVLPSGSLKSANEL